MSLTPGSCITKRYMAVMNLISQKASVFVIASPLGFDKHASLLHYGIIYGSKTFYEIDPWPCQYNFQCTKFCH